MPMAVARWVGRWGACPAMAVVLDMAVDMPHLRRLHPFTAADIAGVVASTAIICAVSMAEDASGKALAIDTAVAHCSPRASHAGDGPAN